MNIDEDKKASAKVLQLIKVADLFHSAHKELAADALAAVYSLENYSERWRYMHEASVRNERKLLGIDDNGNPEPFGKWIARKLGLRS